MNIISKIVRRSCTFASKQSTNVIIKRNMSYYTKHSRRFKRNSNSKSIGPIVKSGFGSTIIGAFAAYTVAIYGYAYIQQKSRPFNSFSTCDQVMEGIDLTGKYTIITGCNTGIGKETAAAMVKSGATVIMACRNLKKANKARDDIIARFDQIEQNDISKRLIIIQLDLGSLQSVYYFSEEFVKTGLKCDYLINNAGIAMLPDYQTTADNIERQWGVNHLGHFYLCKLLLDPVIIPNKTRVINVASQGHKYGGTYDNLKKVFTKAIEEKDFMGSQKNTYECGYLYGISKSSNILFARELNNKYKDKGVISVSLHPGGNFSTDLNRSFSWKSWTSLMQFLPQMLFTPWFITDMHNIKQICATTLRCVTLKDDEIIGGEYYENCVPSTITGRKYEPCLIKGDDDVLAKKLWILSETIIENKGFDLKL